MKVRAIVLAGALVLPVLADEGMWLFNQFPRDQVKEKYSFDITGDFLDHLRLSSLRIGSGSGSFVSANGLVFTNHHVASDCILKISSREHNYVEDGFYAAARSAELPCPGLEADVLVQTDDVTAQVKGA